VHFAFTCLKGRWLEMEIRIAKPPEALLAKFAKHEQAFYFQHAEIVKTILSMPEVQETMHLMATNERLDLGKIRDIRVMVFPHGSSESEQEHRKHLKLGSELGCSGTYTPITGTISIYPIFSNPDKQALKLLRDCTMIAWITINAVSAFLEEVLHSKYNSEYMTKEHLSLQELEKEARRIADEYTDIFVSNTKPHRKNGNTRVK
jgi:hypothetical protein